jgi:hypothetical protein
MVKKYELRPELMEMVPLIDVYFFIYNIKLEGTVAKILF